MAYAGRDSKPGNDFKIGTFRPANRVLAAPMAGFTDRAYREIAHQHGAGLVYSEMISAMALVRGSVKTGEMIAVKDEPYPVAVQLFGSQPEILAAAARKVEAAGAAIIDLNMGCPTPKIVKNMEGCALMRNPALAGEMVRQVKQAVRIPVTVKIRKGWDANSINAVEIAGILAENGAAAITVHGRTRDEFYRGRADWEIIGRVKKAVKIPVIGNGDVMSPCDAKRLLDTTGCDGVMIGRGSLGNPWIFQNTANFLTAGTIPNPVGAGEKITQALEHLRLAAAYRGEAVAVREMKKHLAWYLGGLPNAALVRRRINDAAALTELAAVLQGYLAELMLTLLV